MDLGAAELGVIEEKGRFCGSESELAMEVIGCVSNVFLRLFLEGDCCTLRAVLGFGRRSDREGCDLSTVDGQHLGSL